MATSPDSHLHTIKLHLNIVGRSHPATCCICLLREAVLQEAERHVALRLRHADQPRHETGVNKNRLQTCDRVDSNDGVNGLDWIPPRNGGDGISRSGLVEAGVKGIKGLEVDLVWARKR